MNQKLMTDGNDMKIEPHLSPFCTSCAVFLRENGPKLPISGFLLPGPQCNCEPAVDGTESLYAASEKTKRVEGIGGQNDEPA